MTVYGFRGNAGSSSSAIKLRIYFWNPSLLLDAAFFILSHTSFNLCNMDSASPRFISTSAKTASMPQHLDSSSRTFSCSLISTRPIHDFRYSPTLTVFIGNGRLNSDFNDSIARQSFSRRLMSIATIFSDLSFASSSIKFCKPLI